jgi:signal transduction histidine kinase
MKGIHTSLNNLEKSYAKVNLYFIIVAFTNAIIVVCCDGFIYLKHHYYYLFSINIGLLALIIADILLVSTRKLTIKGAFIIYLYVLLINITLTHLYEINISNFIGHVIMIGFWGLLFVVVGGIALGKYHPYIAAIWAGSLLTFDIVRTENEYLIEVVPVIFVTLIGICIGVNSYMNILRESFLKNQDALNEIFTQKEQIELQTQVLKTNNEHLLALQNMQKELIEMLVHDMKNPLNSILNNASKQPSGLEQKSIYEAGRQMLVLVENMLDVYHMEKTNPQLVIRDIHVAGAVQMAYEQVEYLIYQHSMSMEIRVDSHLFVKADSYILIRVLVNLFTNAIKHSPDNSVLTVFTDWESNGNVIISVKDQGEGIPHLFKDRIFEKYVRVISLKPGAVRSTGLGLTFCKMSVELMNGQIWIADSTSKGTTISIKLPFSKTVHFKKQKHDTQIRIYLLPEDISLLEPIVNEINKLQLYQAGLILNILNKIEPANTRIEEWVNNVQNAIYSINHEKFKEMLEIVSYNELDPKK